MSSIIHRMTLVALVVGIFWLQPTSAQENIEDLEDRLQMWVQSYVDFKKKMTRCPTQTNTNREYELLKYCQDDLKALENGEKQIARLKASIARIQHREGGGGGGGGGGDGVVTTTTTTPKPDCDPTIIDLNKIIYQDC